MLFIARILILLLCALHPVSHAVELVVNDVNWPPFFMPNNREYPGLAKELINHCLKNNRIDFKYRQLPIKRTAVFLQSGEIDIAVYSQKAARKAFVDYASQPIFWSNYGFVVRQNSQIHITKLDDIQHYRFGYLAGLAYTPELLNVIKQMRVKNKVVDGYNLTDMLKQLTLQPTRIDIIADSIETFYWQTKNLKLTNKIKVLDYLIKHKPYYLVVSKNSKHIHNNHQFLQKMDRCISEYNKTKHYQLLLNKYGLQ